MANEINIGINTTSDLSGLNQVDESVKSLKTQLKEAQANVAALSEKFGATSQQAIDAAKSAAVLKDKIGDAKNLTDAFNPDAKFKSLVGSLTGVAGGFSAVTGAMGILGGKSKDVEQAIAKVNQAMALASGVQALGESIDSFKQLAAVIRSTTIFQRVATAAQWLWNAAMSANPIGAIVVAITALIAAGYLLVRMFQESNETLEVSEEATKKNTKAVEEQTKKLEENRKKKEELQDYELRLMKAQGKSSEAIAKRAIVIAKENEAEAWKNYHLKRNTLEMYKNTIATHDATQAELDRKIALEEFGSTLKVHYQEQKKENERNLKDAKEHLNAAILANNEAVKVVNDAVDKRIKSEQGLTILLAEEKTAANKAAIDKQKEHDNKLAEQRKQKAEKINEENKKRASDDAEFLKGLNNQAQELEADTEVKKENLRHEADLKRIAQMKVTSQRINAENLERENHEKRLAEARSKDQETEYQNAVKLQNEKDAGFDADLQKSLAHYEALLAIQVKYGKNTVETQQQIDKTNEEIKKENYNKELELLNAQYTDLDTDLQKKDEYYKKLLILQKLYGEKTIETENEVKKTQKDLDKQALDEKAATIDAVGKMMVAGAEIGNFIADSLKNSAGKDKNRQKTAVRVGAASSVAGVIGSTMSANAGFLANPASISTMGLAAAAPIATNLASSAIAIAKIISEKNKAIAEIDNTSTDAGGDAAKPTPSKFATGGLVTGMGTSTSDSIIANLSNGESVINAKSTAMFGNLLSSINEAGGGVSFANKNQANPIFKTYVVASEMTSQIEANLKLKQIARL
jgi:hypothetical protein